MSALRRAGRVATSLATVTAILGCGVGAGATTHRQHSPGDGSSYQVGHVKVLNVLAVAAGAGKPTPSLVMAMANTDDRPDRLVGIEAPAQGPVRREVPREIPAEGLLMLGGPGADGLALVPGLRARPGQQVELRLTFERAGTLHGVTALLAPSDGWYRGFQPLPGATAAARAE